MSLRLRASVGTTITFELLGERGPTLHNGAPIVTTASRVATSTYVAEKNALGGMFGYVTLSRETLFLQFEVQYNSGY